MLMIMRLVVGGASCAPSASSGRERPPRPRVMRSTAPTSRSSSAASDLAAGAQLLAALGGVRTNVSRSMPRAVRSARSLAHRRSAALNCTGMRADVVVLAQRVADPVLGHEDAGEVGVARRRRCRTCRTPRAPWPRCRATGRTATAPTGRRPGTWTRTRRRRRLLEVDEVHHDLEALGRPRRRAASGPGGSGSRPRRGRCTSRSRRRRRAFISVR